MTFYYYFSQPISGRDHFTIKKDHPESFRGDFRCFRSGSLLKSLRPLRLPASTGLLKFYLMRFDQYNIAPEIKQSLVELGFKRPTDIQFKAIPSILKGEDLLAIAQTGTGKTAAFAIPIIHQIEKRKTSKRSENIKCLVMVPTHELAEQVDKVFNSLSKYTKVKSFAIFGGTEQDSQIRKLTKGIDILVSTPGRMFDLISQGHIKLNRIETLVLDEADHMLALGFIKDIRDLMKHIPKYRQTLFFSATINDEIKKLAYSLVKNAIRIQLSPKDPVAKNIEHGVIYVAMDDKRFFLERLVNENENNKFLVFVRTKVRAERVLKAMQRVNITAVTIHSDKEHIERKQAMNQFRVGEIKLLIATDVSARGIDIPDVDYVVNYDLPDVAENYVHRVGRTGRGKNKGTAISFCSPEEKEVLNTIETFLTKPIEVLEVTKADRKETISLSSEIENDWKKLMLDTEETVNKKSKKKN